MDPSGIEPDASACLDALKKAVCKGSALPDELWAHSVIIIKVNLKMFSQATVVVSSALVFPKKI